MSKRVVLISGAKGGLGGAVTRRFLDNGDTVVGASRSIRKSDFPTGDFLPAPTDFSNSDSVAKLVEHAMSSYSRVDVAVHIVGGFAGGTPLHETAEQTWRQMLDENLTAAFNLVRAVIPAMRGAGTGRFIAVGSKAAEQPLANLGAYVISKSALVTLVKTVALENADRGITANVVLPGTMDTPGNRAAMPSADFHQWVPTTNVAEAIFWLASEAASHVNGAAIPVA
jgi:NAD(P)-dependent dehydrogenase (short-subunit alcohol dehydrogenase family)